MEERIPTASRLNTLKEYMSPWDMCEYFGRKHPKTFDDWEKLGLRAVIVTGRTKYYKKEDIIEFLDKCRS